MMTSLSSSLPARRCLQLELVCRDMAVPNDMSLTAVKAFIWKRSGDVKIHFRLLDPARPASPPVLKAP